MNFYLLFSVVTFGASFRKSDINCLHIWCFESPEVDHEQNIGPWSRTFQEIEVVQETGWIEPRKGPLNHNLFSVFLLELQYLKVVFLNRLATIHLWAANTFTWSVCNLHMLNLHEKHFVITLELSFFPMFHLLKKYHPLLRLLRYCDVFGTIQILCTTYPK